MIKERYSECILYNRGILNHVQNKRIREQGCEGCENLNTGDIDSICVKICKHYKPKKVDEYASDKALWRW